MADVRRSAVEADTLEAGATSKKHSADLVLAHSAAASWAPVSDDAIASLHAVWRVHLGQNETNVMLSRELRDHHGQTVARSVDWSHDYGSQEEAAPRLRLLGSPDQPLAMVGVAVRALGADWLRERLDECIRSNIIVRELEDKAAIAEAEEREALWKQIDVFFRMEGRNIVLVLQRRGADNPFWRISFSEKWERERFWDWLKWQEHRFEEFSSYLETKSSLQLKSRLLREMLNDEAAAKRMKLSAGGRRPLRFWCGELS